MTRDATTYTKHLTGPSAERRSRRCSALPHDGQDRGRHTSHRSSSRQEHRQVAAARQLLTLVFYGLRDGQIRALDRARAA